MTPPDRTAEQLERDYPQVMFITYSRDDPDEAPVLDVSKTIAEAREQGNRGGFLYRIERLPKSEWTTPIQPAYGNEQFIEVLR